MLEVQVVTSANRHLLADRLDEYVGARRALGADAGRRCGGHAGEATAGAFDHDDAVHLLGYLDSRFVSGTRLMPCSGWAFRGHPFSRRAPVEAGPARREWADWARLFTVPSVRGPGPTGVTGAMCCAVMEYCVGEGIPRVGGLLDAYWLTRWADFGWDVDVLGLPETIDGTSKLAAFMTVSERSLRTVRAATGVTTAQIVHVGPRKPFLSSPANPAGSLPTKKSVR